MSVLLDSCALIGLSARTLPKRARHTLESAGDRWVCAVSAWELAIKAASGKLDFGQPAELWFNGLCRHFELKLVPLETTDLFDAAALPPLHRDPFDRVIIATAHRLACPILTSDRNLARYPGVLTTW